MPRPCECRKAQAGVPRSSLSIMTCPPPLDADAHHPYSVTDAGASGASTSRRARTRVELF
jgi:hypothetical protein